MRRTHELESDFIARLRAARELPDDPTIEQQLARGFLRQIVPVERRPGPGPRLVFWLALGISLGLVAAAVIVLAIVVRSHLGI